MERPDGFDAAAKLCDDLAAFASVLRDVHDASPEKSRLSRPLEQYFQSLVLAAERLLPAGHPMHDSLAALTNDIVRGEQADLDRLDQYEFIRLLQGALQRAFDINGPSLELSRATNAIVASIPKRDLPTAKHRGRKIDERELSPRPNPPGDKRRK